MRFLPASLALTLFLSLPLRAEKNDAIQWVSFTDGLKSAPAGGKYMFVDIYAQWCGYCKQLDAVTFRSAPVIAELHKHFVSMRLDADGDMEVSWKGTQMTSRELATRWKVDGLPTLMFLNPKGEIIGSFTSYADPDLMVKLLTYISSGARERKISFDDYVKGPS